MRIERRRAQRIKVNLRARWEGSLSQQVAQITNLSSNGCFVLTGGKVETKELVRMEISLPDQPPVYAWAEVVEEASEIGFAVRFTSMDTEDRDRLDSFIRHALAVS
jgi:hypothetical protein